MKKSILFLSSLLIVFCTAGCGIFPSTVSAVIGVNNMDIIDGGTKHNTNHNAPKEIKSNNLVSFSASFFRYGEYGFSDDGWYCFTVEKDDSGKLMLNEDRCFNISCEVDEAVLNKLQEIIKNNDLVQLNGTDELTYGLPPEFDASFLKAVYDSGESIYFSMNNDPYVSWTEEVLSYLGSVFTQHGFDNFLPPEGSTDITRFEFEFTNGDIRYNYGEVLIPKPTTAKKSFEEVVTHGYEDNECYTVIMSNPWDRSGKTEPVDKWANPTSNYYAELQKIVEETGLKKFSNHDSYPFGFDYDNTPAYYHFYIEYAYGNVLYGFSADPEENAAFAPVAQRFAEYLDKYIAENKVEKTL